MQVMKTICWLCYKVAAPDLKGVIRHMAVVHAHESEFHIICGIAGCVRSYSNFYSFRRHVYRKHREHLNITSRRLTAAHSVVSTATANNEFDFVNLLECDDFDDTQFNFQHTKSMALFLLKAKELRKVSQTSLDSLTSDFTNILQKIIEQLKSDINRCLQTSGINMESIQGLSETFNQENITNPFHQLESRYQQEKFYREHLNLLVGIKSTYKCTYRIERMFNLAGDYFRKSSAICVCVYVFTFFLFTFAKHYHCQTFRL